MNKNEFKKIIREEIENILKENRFSQYLIADFIEKNQSLFTGKPLYQEQPISHTINFLKTGRPSQFYLKKLVDTLTHLGYDVDEKMFIEEPKPPLPPFKPSSGPTIPSKGYMGSEWTGD